MERIADALEQLLVRPEGGIKSRIEEISLSIDIPETNSKGYCHCIKTDASGNLRLNDLIEYIDGKIIDYAIPKKEIDNAIEYLNRTKSTSKIIELEKKARKLFTSLKKTGEGGEILLYILIQEYLRYPQLISKMSLKTSGELHYQGADGIHVNYDEETDTLNLYWAEAKVFKKINDAIANCFESLHVFLLNPYEKTSPQERDLQLITSNIQANVNNPALEDALVKYFDKDSDFSNKVVYKGVCFIGFNCDSYPKADDLSKTTAIIKKAIEAEHHKWYKTLGVNINKYTNLNTKEIHIFLLPFPCVETFRSHFLEAIKS